MRSLYQALVPHEWRYLFYKFRNPQGFRELRRAVYPSPRGDFSLRGFDESRAIFVHVPKAAGTSVALGLFGQLPYHYTALQYRVIFGRKDFERYFKFSFVRNPWDRLHSAYTFLQGGGWDDKDRAWFDANLSRFPDFEAFVMDWLTRDRRSDYIHFRPQVDFVCDRRLNLLVDQLGRFENLARDYASVARRLGRPETVTHANASRKTNYNSAYSDEMKQHVEDVYAEDIETFDYSFERQRP